MSPRIELHELEVFLVLADELHFGRAADRLGLTSSRVSQVVRKLERQMHVRLFDRTSRSVQLTPAGAQCLAQVQPAYLALADVLTTITAPHDEDRILVIGVTPVTDLPVVGELVRRFRNMNPECEVRLREVDAWDPYRALRHHEVDTVINWLVVDEPDLSFGAPIAAFPRVLAVAHDHPLADRDTVDLDDVAGHAVAEPPASFPTALADAILPPVTPSGRSIARVSISHSLTEIVTQVALGTIVHPTMATMTTFARDDIVLIPIRDLPPVPLGPIWRAATSRPVVDKLIGAIGELQN